ncbi:MAG: hypothetical protein KatS3mg101_0670 [Patescibacteria group bacterium]|nr:MAG: hypothetical protein KatS3mg101_0670 [Patescibacteria group bacterium]
MKSSKPIIIVIVLILLIAGGYVGFKNLKKTTIQTQKQPESAIETEQPKNAEESYFSGSLKDLFSLAKDVECTYSYSDEKNKTSGVMYVSGKNLRSDSKVTVEDGTIVESSFILKDNMMYMWGPSMPYGVKISVEEEMLDSTAEGSEGEKVPENLASLQKKVDYKCSPWIVDVSKFELPENVEFKEMVVPSRSQVENNNQNMCGMCDLIQDEENKVQCLSTFNCE